ncbi:hypothetical protein QFC21_004198 [Naganishia friedmannii]|uniref:Uncharacterized protein n=1 Tax=Naganishia friedmannii TaxID=89922 RepID=A0ACC2VL78_9TREE|nr:hypothetical protein QFC21_004198 [Naganishia friedmannii]
MMPAETITRRFGAAMTTSTTSTKAAKNNAPPPTTRTAEVCLTCSAPCPSTVFTNKTFITPCCDRPICVACITRNPRIVEYVPCLWCGEGVGVVSSTKGKRRVVLRSGVEGGSIGEGGEVFVLGDEDGDGEEEGGDGSPPPAYQETGPTKSNIAADNANGISTPTTANVLDDSCSTPGFEMNHTPPAQATRKHRVRKGETVRSLALSYKIDPYLLAKTNGLPYTSLTTHPGVLQTRREVLVPCSASGGGQAEDDDPAEVVSLGVERFQLITKETDPWVARTYVAIHSSSSAETLSPAADPPSDDHDYEQKISGEKSMLVGDGGEKEKSTRPGEGTSRGDGVAGAIEMFYADEEWESAAAPSGASGRLSRVRR